MEETSWVRSIYLYAMCVVSIALVALGSVGVVVGLVHTIAPDLGHHDSIDRVGIGASNVAKHVVELLNESQADDQAVDPSQMNTIIDGIGEVRSELQRQIRNNSVDAMIRGLLFAGVGLLLWRIHARRTALFADGLMLRAAKPAPGPGTETPAMS